MAQCNVANMTKFVEALESGNYTQITTGDLALMKEDNLCLCAEGVACEVSGLGRWIQPPGDRDMIEGTMVYEIPLGDDLPNYLILGYIVGGPVIEWLGLNADTIKIDNQVLYRLNDSELYSFPELAALLRAEYL